MTVAPSPKRYRLRYFHDAALQTDLFPHWIPVIVFAILSTV
jgi:hypothetical protein